MLPVIQQINESSNEEKAQLVTAGFALFGPGGKLFLSLAAVDKLGMQMIASNPLVQVGKEMEHNEDSREACIETNEVTLKLTASVVNSLYNSMHSAVEFGIPIYQCFNLFMATAPEDRDSIDYSVPLQQWRDQVIATKAAKAAAQQLN